MNTLILALATLAGAPAPVEGRMVGWRIAVDGGHSAPILGVPTAWSRETMVWEAYRAPIAGPDGRSIEPDDLREGMYLVVRNPGKDDCRIEVRDDPRARIDALIAAAEDGWRRAPSDAAAELARLDRTLGARLFRVREKAARLIRRAVARRGPVDGPGDEVARPRGPAAGGIHAG